MKRRIRIVDDGHDHEESMGTLLALGGYDMEIALRGRFSSSRSTRPYCYQRPERR